MCILTLDGHVDAAVRSTYFWEGWRPTSTTWNPTWPFPADVADKGDGDVSEDDAQSGDDYEEDDGAADSSGDDRYSTDSTASDFDSLDGYGSDSDNPHHSFYLTDSFGTPHHSAGCLVVPSPALDRDKIPKRGYSGNYYPTTIEWSPDGTQICATFYYRLLVFSVVGDDTAILAAPIQESRLFVAHDGTFGRTAWPPSPIIPPPRLRADARSKMEP